MCRLRSARMRKNSCTDKNGIPFNSFVQYRILDSPFGAGIWHPTSLKTQEVS